MNKLISNFLKRLSPERLIFWSFLGAIIVGGLLLKLPQCSVRGISWIDAFFTSASAICVTGLSVFDISSELTLPGKIVLLFLIQIGGLGILTFSVFFSLLLRVRTSIASRISVGSLSRRIDGPNLLRSLALVLIMTAFFEGLGAVLLFLRFREIHPFPEAILYSIFHAISAFCNCGFSLYPDNLIRFQQDFLVLPVMMFLIVAGGIGFIVIIEVHDYLVARFKKNKFQFSLHSRVAIQGTLLLIFIAADILLFTEQRNVFSGMPVPQQFLNAFFLSITPRTAGFNSIDTGTLTNASLFFIIFLMFIGGCPGSTAGGIKVTTFFVLIALIRGKLQQSSMASLLKRKIPQESVDKALAVFGAAIVILCVITFFLQITEEIVIKNFFGQRKFLDLLFEATSALGTVGLSTGITPLLSAPGKSLIILLMFLGRIGPLAIGIALLPKGRKQIQAEYPEADVVIG